MGTSVDDLSEADVPYLNVHSNGWHEFTPGLDLVFYWHAWSLVTSEAIILRPEKTKTMAEGESVIYRAGLGNRTLLSLAYTFYGYGQLSGGGEREFFARNRMDGATLPDSQVRRYAWFTTTQARIGLRRTIELGLRRSGFDGNNENTPRYTMVTVGYAESF